MKLSLAEKIDDMQNTVEVSEYLENKKQVKEKLHSVLEQPSQKSLLDEPLDLSSRRASIESTLPDQSKIVYYQHAGDEWHILENKS